MIRFLYIAFLCLVGLQFSGQSEVKIILGADSIAIGEQTELSIEVIYPLKDAASLIWPTYKDTLTSTIEILSRSVVDTILADVDSADDYFKQVTTWTITCFEEGFYPIPPMRFKLGEEFIESNALLLSVGQPILLEDQAFKDIKEIRDINYGFSDFLREFGWHLLLVLLAIGLIIFVIVKIKRRPKKDASMVEEIKVLEPAHIIALRELAELKQDSLWQRGNIKGYYSRLTTILRTYIELRFKTQALEETTDQIIRDLKALDLDPLIVARFGTMLRLADLAKFAKAKPLANDNENSMLIAEQFVKDTMSTQEPGE
jgi:hypothetical protein